MEIQQRAPAGVRMRRLSMKRIGSMFSGCGGLDLAVEKVFGGRVVWQFEINAAASKVLALSLIHI